MKIILLGAILTTTAACSDQQSESSTRTLGESASMTSLDRTQGESIESGTSDQTSDAVASQNNQSEEDGSQNNTTTANEKPNPYSEYVNIDEYEQEGSKFIDDVAGVPSKSITGSYQKAAAFGTFENLHITCLYYSLYSSPAVLECQPMTTDQEYGYKAYVDGIEKGIEIKHLPIKFSKEDVNEYSCHPKEIDPTIVRCSIDFKRPFVVRAEALIIDHNNKRFRLESAHAQVNEITPSVLKGPVAVSLTSVDQEVDDCISRGGELQVQVTASYPHTISKCVMPSK